jgi:hypothetical protein
MNKVLYEFKKTQTRIDDITILQLRDAVIAEIARRRKAAENNLIIGSGKVSNGDKNESA